MHQAMLKESVLNSTDAYSIDNATDSTAFNLPPGPTPPLNPVSAGPSKRQAQPDTATGPLIACAIDDRSPHPSPLIAPALATNPLPITPSGTKQPLTPSSTSDARPGGMSDKARRCLKAKQREKLKKELLQQSCSQGAFIANPGLINHHLKAGARAHGAKLAPSDLPHTSTGYQGLRDQGAAQRVFSLHELLGMGFELKAWDGRYVGPLPCPAPVHIDCPALRTPTPLLDSLGNIFGVCSGQPKDTSWASVCEGAAAAIKKARGKCDFPDGSINHRRGRFPAMAVGVSFGGGQQVRRWRSPLRLCLLTPMPCSTPATLFTPT